MRGRGSLKVAFSSQLKGLLETRRQIRRLCVRRDQMQTGVVWPCWTSSG